MLKLFKLTLLSLALISLFCTHVGAADATVTLKKPPTSLKDWYKPSNKRQVWLHTMFRLRRQVLAIKDYSQAQEPKLLQKWFDGFEKDYQEVGKMVPEWQDSLDLSGLTNLQSAVAKKDYPAIPKLLEKLQNSCVDCHADYQAVTRLIYRSADFAKIKVREPHSGRKIAYDKGMEELSNAVNRIKIAMHDDLYPQAIAYLEPLQSRLKSLTDGCSDCHKPADEQIDYIINSSQPILAELKQALEQKDNKQARISLGTFAVKTCARCHSVHRTTAELKELIE